MDRGGRSYLLSLRQTLRGDRQDFWLLATLKVWRLTTFPCTCGCSSWAARLTNIVQLIQRVSSATQLSTTHTWIGVAGWVEPSRPYVHRLQSYTLVTILTFLFCGNNTGTQHMTSLTDGVPLSLPTFLGKLALISSACPLFRVRCHVASSLRQQNGQGIYNETICCQHMYMSSHNSHATSTLIHTRTHAITHCGVSANNW